MAAHLDFFFSLWDFCLKTISLKLFFDLTYLVLKNVNQYLFLVDIPLLPSITSLSLGENEEKSGPFIVHWLNNKELHFTLSMEVFLQQLKRSFEHHSPETNTEDSNQMDGRSEEGKSHADVCHTQKWLSVFEVICNVPPGGSERLAT